MTISVLYYVSFGWLGTVVGIVGLILAVVGIVLTLRSRAVARLVYQTRDLVLVGQPDAIPYGEVKILFNDNVVPRVMRLSECGLRGYLGAAAPVPGSGTARLRK